MRSVKAQLGKLEEQLKQWDAELHELAGEVDEASAEAKIGYRKRVDELGTQHQMLRARLAELEAPGSVRPDRFWASVRWKRVRRHLQETEAPPETRG
jgi:hypothetical protein